MSLLFDNVSQRADLRHYHFNNIQTDTVACNHVSVFCKKKTPITISDECVGTVKVISLFTGNIRESNAPRGPLVGQRTEISYNPLAGPSLKAHQTFDP